MVKKNNEKNCENYDYFWFAIKNEMSTSHLLIANFIYQQIKSFYKNPIFRKIFNNNLKNKILGFEIFFIIKNDNASRNG